MLLFAEAGRAVEGPGQGGEGDNRQEPPRVHFRRVGEDRGEAKADHHEGGDVPVVADDEVVPERAERLELLHEVTTSDCLAGAAPVILRERSQKMQAAPTSATTGTRTSRAASLPGQATPAPSAPQNVPKLVSMTPTANFIQFSGTLVSGALTAMPTTVTRMIAAAAPMTAAPMFFWLVPKVITMKTTSRPSRSTPLKARVKEYQSLTPRLDSLVAASAAATSLRYALASSCSAL